MQQTDSNVRGRVSLTFILVHPMEPQTSLLAAVFVSQALDYAGSTPYVRDNIISHITYVPTMAARQQEQLMSGERSSVAELPYSDMNPEKNQSMKKELHAIAQAAAI